MSERSRSEQTTEPDFTELITIKQAAEAIGVTPWIMYQLAHEEEREAFRQNYPILVGVDSLTEYAQAMGKFLAASTRRPWPR